MARTRTLWMTTNHSATKIGLMFDPPVTRNVILGRVKRLKLIGFPRPKGGAEVIALPPPAQRPKPAPRRTIEKLAAAPPIADLTPKDVQDRFATAVETMRPFVDRGHGQCAYPITIAGAYYFCCAPISKGSFCEAHARLCYEASA